MIEKNIVMLANAGHNPFDSRIFYKEAVSLAQAGYTIKIIIPSESSGIKSGIEIISVGMPQKGWRKLFALPIAILRRALRESKSAVYHIHDSELLVIAFLLKLTGRKVIYDAHEDTPLQISYQHWIPEYLKGFYALLYRVLEWLAGHAFDAIIIAEPVLAKYYPVSKTFLIRNFPSLLQFDHEPEPFGSRKNNAVYIGLLSEVRGLFEMLEASTKAKKLIAFNFVLGGKFSPQELSKRASKFEVDFREWVGYDDLITLLGDSKIGLILPHPIPRYLTNYPVKLFEYMAAGMAIVGPNLGETYKFLDEGRAGIAVNPMDTDQIAKAIIWLFENQEEAELMGKRGRKLIEEKYNWEWESKNLLKLYGSFFN